jgi:hypothetical protein
VKRRELVTLIGAAVLAWPFRSFGQSASALALVGVLWPRKLEPARVAAVRGGLAEGGQAAKLPTIGFLGASSASAWSHGLPLSFSGCTSSAGSRAAPSRSSIAGRRRATSATSSWQCGHSIESDALLSPTSPNLQT